MNRIIKPNTLLSKSYEVRDGDEVMTFHSPRMARKWMDEKRKAHELTQLVEVDGKTVRDSPNQEINFEVGDYVRRKIDPFRGCIGSIKNINRSSRMYQVCYRGGFVWERESNIEHPYASLKVGDKVMVREGSMTDEEKGGFCIPSEMVGNIYEIEIPYGLRHDGDLWWFKSHHLDLIYD